RAASRARSVLASAGPQAKALRPRPERHPTVRFRAQSASRCRRSTAISHHRVGHGGDPDSQGSSVSCSSTGPWASYSQVPSTVRLSSWLSSLSFGCAPSQLQLVHDRLGAATDVVETVGQHFAFRLVGDDVAGIDQLAIDRIERLTNGRLERLAGVKDLVLRLLLSGNTEGGRHDDELIALHLDRRKLCC